MKCTNCGNQLKQGAKFCIQCGTEVAEQSSQATGQNSGNQELEMQKNQGKKTISKKQNKATIFAMAGIAAIVVIFGIYKFVIEPNMENVKNYKLAVSCYGSGKYENAGKLFELLGDYKDSEKKWEECQLEYAKSLIYAEKVGNEENITESIEEAKGILEELQKVDTIHKYLSEEKIKNVDNLLLQCNNFEKVKGYKKQGLYSEAIKILGEMDSCKIVTKMTEECKREMEEESSYEEDEDNEEVEDYEEDEDNEEESEYLLPESSDYYLSGSDIENLSQRELSIARNEIYARHGRTFQSQELQNYFDSQSWYEGYYSEIPDSELSQVEKDNIKLIQQYEQDEYGAAYKWD